MGSFNLALLIPTNKGPTPAKVGVQSLPALDNAWRLPPTQPHGTPYAY